MECNKFDYADCSREQLLDIYDEYNIAYDDDHTDDYLRERLMEVMLSLQYDIPRLWRHRDGIIHKVNKHIVAEEAKADPAPVDIDEWMNYEQLSEAKLRRILYMHGYSTTGNRAKLLKRIRRVRSSFKRTYQYKFENTICSKLSTKANNNEFINTNRKNVRAGMWYVTKDNWKDIFRNKNGLRKLFNLYDKYFFNYRLSRMLKEYNRKLTFIWGRNYQHEILGYTRKLTDRDSIIYVEEVPIAKQLTTCIRPVVFVRPGTECNTLDPIYAIMMTLEHELVHLIIDVSCFHEARRRSSIAQRDKYNIEDSVELHGRSGHTALFMRILQNLFGHTRFWGNEKCKIDKLQYKYHQLHPMYSKLYDSTDSDNKQPIRDALGIHYKRRLEADGKTKADKWLIAKERRHGIELHPEGDEAHSWWQYPESFVNDAEGVINVIAGKKVFGDGIVNWFRGLGDKNYPHLYPISEIPS